MSGVLGPLLGGIITNYTSWRWIFWINAPIGIGPLILFAIAWPNAQKLRPAEKRPVRQMDFLGFFFLIAASVPFVFAFQQAGIHVIANKKIWSTAIFVAPLGISIVCWAALFGWEYLISIRWADYISALFPMRLAKSRVYLCAAITTMLSGFPYFVIIYALPTHFQVVHGCSALSSGIALLPMLGASAVGSTVGGVISGKKNNTFPAMMVGGAFMLIGTATLSTLENVVHAPAKEYALQIFVGLGFGLTISNSSMIAASESEIRDNGMSTPSSLRCI
jgi:MFS family permease